MNLLKNPNFDQGHHHQDNIPEIVVPDDWLLRWIDGGTFPGIGNPPAYRPESVVWHIIHAPPHEKPIFFLEGDYCWKVFKLYAPVYFAASQVVTGLEAGVAYRFTAQVYPDIVEGYHAGQKVRPGDIWHSEARVGWSKPNPPWPQHEDEGAITWSKWFNVNNGNLVFGEYNDIWMNFLAPGGPVEVVVECKSKWGSGENNWFMDAFTLEPVEEGEDISVPPIPRGMPRVQYDRSYILLPSSLPLDMALAAMRVAYQTHTTIGFSPDDAGVGDLDVRRVIAVSPEEIGNGLTQAWYEQYYPGVEFVAVSYPTSPANLEARLKALF
jgi:hypothetical protein